MSTATTSLTLATQRPFGTLTCDFYKNDSGEFYMTREQIAQALEYPAGAKAIAQIHSRNADRLNPMSGVLKMKTPVVNRILLSTTSVVSWKSAASPAKIKPISSWTLSGM